MADATFIATANIEAAPGVLAFTKGQIVPASAVENLKAQDKVSSERTKAAQAAVKEQAEPKA